MQEIWRPEVCIPAQVRIFFLKSKTSRSQKKNKIATKDNFESKMQ
jgi:hypothetical protein